MVNIWNVPAPPKRSDASALVDASALLPLLSSTFLWLSNQTKNGAILLYSVIQLNKKWNDYMLLAEHIMKRLHSQKIE
jgi:hypothetical protein